MATRESALPCISKKLEQEPAHYWLSSMLVAPFAEKIA